MKPSGSFWLNLGDTYCSSGKWVNKEVGDIGKQNRSVEGGAVNAYSMRGKLKPDGGWIQPKQLLLIPSRVATALQHDGWILRNDIIWYKPNHMPSSVKDRLTNAYEHVFLLVKQRRYYFDLDMIRVLHKGRSSGNLLRTYLPDPRQEGREHYGRSFPWTPTELGKNPGDVWTIPTKPFPAAHFATFPPQLIEPIVKAGCPENGIVLDPFCGSGTALRAARKLGRHFIGIDIVPEYCEMARRRVQSDSYRNPPEKVVPLDFKKT
ncbi:Modification methylase DpnIIB [subsurface metagenome]